MNKSSKHITNLDKDATEPKKNLQQFKLYDEFSFV